MKNYIYKNKANLKGLLFITGILLIIFGIWYSQKLVTVLENQATEYVQFRIKVFEKDINNPNFNTNIDFLFNEVIRTADYPIIYTDKEGNPQSWVNLPYGLDDKTMDKFSSADSVHLFSLLQEMSEEHKPIPIKFQNKVVLGYYHYGFSPVIYKLRIFPYVAIGAAALFILIGYLGFSYIRRNEEQFIWVGMAKETAHQLGTPLSSISGWLELLKADLSVKDTAVSEIQNDLIRLNKIANRFSKIGSVPELKPVSLNRVIENVVGYFQKRLPNMQRTITISYHSEQALRLALNEELFEWVLENLIKNSVDAIEKERGQITLKSFYSAGKNLVYIDIADNGKGITQQQRKNIFKPGFSSKKRGWGLGLSLARRIIEQYHGGKLFLKESHPGQGSTFRIVLKHSNKD